MTMIIDTILGGKKTKTAYESRKGMMPWTQALGGLSEGARVFRKEIYSQINILPFSELDVLR